MYNITENVHLTSTIVVAVHNVICSVVCLSFRFRPPPPASNHRRSKRAHPSSRTGEAVNRLSQIPPSKNPHANVYHAVKRP